MSEPNSNKWMDQILDVIKNNEQLPKITDEIDCDEEDFISEELGNF